MKIIKVTTLNEQGKTTLPKELLEEWKIAGKPAKLLWYMENNKICIKPIKK